MKFYSHKELAGKHALLSASQYSWLNYDAEKMETVYRNKLAVEQGTRLHNIAAELIDLKIKLPRSSKTLNMYVNDCIGFDMTPEQVLYYSPNCFGTADAIKFAKNKLRIFDLKTGKNPAKFDQLIVYSALFCHEYMVKPEDISIELRLYQSNEVKVYEPTAEEVRKVMTHIVEMDNVINSVLAEEE